MLATGAESSRCVILTREIRYSPRSLELPPANNRYVARAMRLLHFARTGKLVELAIDAALSEYEPCPTWFDEDSWCIRRTLGRF